MHETALDRHHAGHGDAVATQRFVLGMGWGSLAAAVLMTLGLRLRPDLADAVQLPMFWIKLAFIATLLAPSVSAAMRLMRPEARLGWIPAALAMPVFAMWCFAAFALLRAEPSELPGLLLSEMWWMCPLFVAALSLPVLVGVLWAMRGFVPARHRLAGGAAGLAAGTTSGLIYAFHCPDLAAPFIGIWYLLGMLAPAAVGALVAPRLLTASAPGKEKAG